MINEIDIDDFLREQKNQTKMAVAEDKHSQQNAHEDQEGNPNQSEIEYKYVTCHDNLRDKVNEGKVTPRLVSYEVESEVDSDRAISPLYEDLYEEVVIDAWPPFIKEEVDQENVQQTPPRTVVFEETIRNTPVKQRVGLKNSEKREAQKTKPAKDRLGTKPSDFKPKNQEPENTVPIHERLGERRGDTCDRIQPAPREVPSNQQSTPVKLRLGKTNLEKREAQRKSRKTRDQASSRQRLPREAKSNQKSESKCNQIGGYIFHTREEETTDTEEEIPKSSKSKE